MGDKNLKIVYCSLKYIENKVFGVTDHSAEKAGSTSIVTKFAQFQYVDRIVEWFSHMTLRQ